MRLVLAVSAAVLVALAVGQTVNEAHPQEPRLATFQETAQVLVDRTLSGNITAAITLQSTSNQEIKIPSDLNRQIMENPRIVSVVLTNQDGCGVLGVYDQSCILVNVLRGPEDTNIVKIFEAARENGDLVIAQLNELFDTGAQYHSSYLHHRDEINVMLGTSGAVSGRDIVSAVYAMPQEDTLPMYQKVAALVLDGHIRDSGGFFEAASQLAAHEHAHMALSIIPTGGTSLFQLRVSSEYPGAGLADRLDPLEYLQTDGIERSRYFEGGFYPLNSILHVVILSPDEIELRGLNADMIPTQEIDGDMIPTDLGRAGWVFEKEAGTKVEGMYLFGQNASVGGNDLLLELGPAGDVDVKPPVGPGGDGDVESIVVVIIIAAAAASAAGFYLKGYRKGLTK